MLASAALLSGVAVGSASAQDKELTLCWAAWDPANALVELSKDFTAETGINMKFEFVPWTSYADRFLNELNSQGTLCDLIIGDSQWIGGSAENGHYVKLNDFFDKEGISMDAFLPADRLRLLDLAEGHAELLGAAGDGRRARLDLSQGLVRASPSCRPSSRQKYGRDLAPPKTWTELKEIAEFFQGREIDGKKVYGAAIFTERGSEGITMGVTAALYSCGFKYQKTPGKPTRWKAPSTRPTPSRRWSSTRSSTSAARRRAIPTPTCRRASTPSSPARSRCMMNWFAFWPGMYKDENVGGDKIGFFVNPEREGRRVHARRAGHLGRLLFRQPGRARSQYIKWFAQARGAEEVVGARRLLLRQVRAARPGLRGSRRPSPPTSSSPWASVQDFWQEPAFAELMQAMQKRVHDYVVADQGTAQEALDMLIEDWTETFEDEGKI